MTMIERPNGRAADHEFDALMTDVMSHADRFGHREHIHLTWLAVRRYGVATATELISEGIRRTARYAGAPQKYHETVSRAWVRLVAHHVDASEEDFTAFVKRNPGLLDKRLLARHYRPTTLAGATARTGWVEPDIIPFPPAQRR